MSEVNVNVELDPKSLAEIGIKDVKEIVITLLTIFCSKKKLNRNWKVTRKVLLLSLVP